MRHLAPEFLISATTQRWTPEELLRTLAEAEITTRENLALVDPAGTGKSHLLVALGIAAVSAGHKVRHFTAADLAETLYRGRADNSVGRIIDGLLRNDLIILNEVGFAPLDDTGAQLLFRVRMSESSSEAGRPAGRL
jgi:DNA replication protein DnaC